MIVCVFFVNCVCAGQRGPCTKSSEVSFLRSLFIKVRTCCVYGGAGLKSFHSFRLQWHWLISALWKNDSDHLIPRWMYSFSPPGFVQFLQYYYQSGCLYRLRALGERSQLDLTVGALEPLLFCCFFFFLSSCRRACTAPSATASLSGTINRAKVKIQQHCQSSSELLSRCLEEFARVAAAAGLSASFKLSNAILQRSSSEAFVVSILWVDKWMEAFLLGRIVVFRGFAAV